MLKMSRVSGTDAHSPQQHGNATVDELTIDFQRACSVVDTEGVPGFDQLGEPADSSPSDRDESSGNESSVCVVPPGSPNFSAEDLDAILDPPEYVDWLSGVGVTSDQAEPRVSSPELSGDVPRDSGLPEVSVVEDSPTGTGTTSEPWSSGMDTGTLANTASRDCAPQSMMQYVGCSLQARPRRAGRRAQRSNPMRWNPPPMLGVYLLEQQQHHDTQLRRVCRRLRCLEERLNEVAGSNEGYSRQEPPPTGPIHKTSRPSRRRSPSRGARSASRHRSVSFPPLPRSEASTVPTTTSPVSWKSQPHTSDPQTAALKATIAAQQLQIQELSRQLQAALARLSSPAPSPSPCPATAPAQTPPQLAPAEEPMNTAPSAASSRASSPTRHPPHKRRSPSSDDVAPERDIVRKTTSFLEAFEQRVMARFVRLEERIASVDNRVATIESHLTALDTRVAVLEARQSATEATLAHLSLPTPLPPAPTPTPSGVMAIRMNQAGVQSRAVVPTDIDRAEEARISSTVLDTLNGGNLG
ncbi:hypothetical protein HPB49_016088 [Dermacentor silvarum]|uniref:Uncharacterized protein n=1 Tax=Dermacentor silvarum TaxID=543639 RepID=A0ACB8CA94_DERSI|nr:hypothetical protein HPB49_016088 [Dermacentor silvarum]